MKIIKTFIVFLIIFKITFIDSKNCLISIPKCGTSLAQKLFRMINPQEPNKIEPEGLCLITNNAINDLLYKDNTFLTAHAIFNNYNNEILKNNNVKIVFIYRDPRDQIVSAAHMIRASKKHWPTHSKWRMDHIISELIEGGGKVWEAVFAAKKECHALKGIKSFYELYLPWINQPNVYTTTFEKLVGPQGGGSLETQINEIQAIAEHLGKPITEARAREISKKLFGGTHTFRQGKIGSWKKHFNEYHKKIFPKQLLVDLGYETKSSKWEKKI